MTLDLNCPYAGCERELPTLKGYASHQRIVHGEYIPPVRRDRLLELYFEDGLSTHEIAEKFDVASSTISGWFDEYDVALPSKEAAVRSPVANFYTDARGYEVWHTGEDGEVIRVTNHRLLAIADGCSPTTVFSGEYHVHHKNGISWDNRRENIELLSVSEHRSHHAKQMKQQKNEF